jgi:hypothetical protein
MIVELPEPGWQVSEGRQMSGFTRDPYWYGGLLVYEPLDSKWRRYHARCRQSGCTGYWLDHVLKAGFRQVGKHQGYFGLVGPGLTEGIDESRLTANALWEAVTGIPGNQDWYETVHVVERDGMPMTGCEICGGGLRCKEARENGWLCAKCNREAKPRG